MNKSEMLKEADRLEREVMDVLYYFQPFDEDELDEKLEAAAILRKKAKML